MTSGLVQSTTGKGIAGKVDGKQVTVGSAKLLSEFNLKDSESMQPTTSQLSGAAQTVVYVAVDGTIAGRLGIADPIKASAPEALATLRGQGLRVVMLTGDSRATATAIATTIRLPITTPLKKKMRGT